MRTIDERVDAAAADVDALHRRFAPALIGWQLIPDSSAGDERAAAWRDLETWLDWLVDAYEVAEWPTCWRQHKGLVQETVALRLDHGSLVAQQKAHDLVVWHEYFCHLRLRAREISGHCHGGKRCSRQTGIG